MCFLISDQIFRRLHHSLDPQSSSSLEISLLVFTIANIALFDHMASFGCLTFHLLAYEFILSLHLTIMGFHQHTICLQSIFPYWFHHFVEHSLFYVSMTSVDRYTVAHDHSNTHGRAGRLPLAIDFDVVSPLRGPSSDLYRDLVGVTPQIPGVR